MPSLLHDLLAAGAVNIGLAAAIVTGLGVIWAKAVVPGWRKLRRAIRMLQRVTQAADRLLPFAEQQLTPNGGSSIADKVSRIPVLEARIDANHAEVTARLKTLELNIAARPAPEE